MLNNKKNNLTENSPAERYSLMHKKSPEYPEPALINGRLYEIILDESGFSQEQV